MRDEAQRWRPDTRGGFPRYLVTPTVAKHRIFVWLDQGVLPDHQLIVFARDDDCFFGVPHSRLHEVWGLKLETRLETRPRCTPTICFETFPFPRPTSTQQSAIAEARRALDASRRNWLGDRSHKKCTLTALYNERPTWLRDAHHRLDTAIFDAYGWDSAMTDEQLLDELLKLNLSGAGTFQAPTL